MQTSPANPRLIDRLGFGCVALTSFATRAEVLRLLDLVHDLGVRHFDTAPVYGQGYSERLLGEFLRRRDGPVSVATKFGMWPARSPDLPLSAALALNALRRRLPKRRSRAASASEEPPVPAIPRLIDRAELERAFDASRRALGRDFIDLYLLHESVPSALAPTAFDYLLSLRDTGRVGRIGLATGASHYAPLTPADLAGWDVLQYEAGPAWPGSEGILQRFPDTTHIFHSCLKGVPRQGSRNAAGIALRRQLEANPRGMVLFSSTKTEHIRANLAALTD